MRVSTGKEKTMKKTMDFKEMYALAEKYNDTDICLRIGSCYMDGEGFMKDDDEAYKFLREAEDAIRKRIEVADYYGDQTVLEKIEDRLREIRS